MAWLQLEIQSGQRDPSPLETRLEELGAVAVWLQDAGDDPVLEPAPGSTPLWPESIVTALFPADSDPEELRTQLSDLLAAEQLKFVHVEDRDWQAEWQATLSPQQFGQRLWVLPDDAATPEACSATNAAIVRLNPGMAFGTGEHPTTAMCLRWLSELDMQGKRVLDYGCGSGLLAIAALALGAKSACGVDIDPQALEASRQNALNNGCLERLRIIDPTAKSDDDSSDYKYDVLVANILSGTLIQLSETLKSQTASSSPVAITGILAEQADEVRAAWADWVELQCSDQVGDWVLLTGLTKEY